MGERVESLAARLHKGIEKTVETLHGLNNEQWQTTLYEKPYPWTVRDMLAHLVSTEEGLARIARDVAAGGPGAPEGLDYDHFNAEEQVRLAGIPVERLLADLAATREATVAWVSELDEADLDRMGHHPALGQVPLETLINVIHGHQLIHMRDLKALLRSSASQ
jgi:1,6-anhydro-N-acetylmuramate kinase